MAAGSVADAAFMAMLSSMQLQQQQQHLLARDDPTGVDPSRDGLSDEGGEGEGVDDESAGDDPAGGGLAGVGDVPAVQQEERGSTGDLCRHPEQPLRGDLMHDRGDENATMVDEQAKNEQAANERCLSLPTSAATELGSPVMELAAPVDVPLAVRDAATELSSPATELGSSAMELAAPVDVPLAVRNTATELGSPAMELAAPVDVPLGELGSPAMELAAPVDVPAIPIVWAIGR